MKISASIYANHSKDLRSLIKSLDAHTIDLFHMDCNDDPSVFEDIEFIRQYSGKPVDIHIISPAPWRYFDLIAKNRPEYVTFQYEELDKILKVPDSITSKLGLSIISETDIAVFEPYSERFDFILFMATTPGRSGGYFDKSNFKKIRQFKSIYPSKGIHVDGGVNGEVSFILRNLGVDTAVAGSYLFKESDLGIAMLNLKVNEVDSQYKLKDFMRCSDEIPMLHRDSATLHNVLHSIEDYKLGFTLVINDNGHLDGIITNADVRKGLLKNLDNLNKTLLEDMLNRTPFTANENHTVIELLNLVKKQKFPVSYLPVVNDSNKLTGAITFVNLIKGEL